MFSGNIRSFIGLTDVNEGRQDTLMNNPESFLYLNNGVTVLCKTINKRPRGGSDKSIGDFYCEGLSIVNGAQTVGTIGETYKKNHEQVEKAKVIIKLISLENCPSGFDLQVTKATNTQNKIENRDFISLDPLQAKLKTEFALMDITYHYKRDDKKSPLDNKNCNLEEATIALACSHNDIRYARLAKDKKGKLWEDVSKPPYTELFHQSISADEIWKKVQIMRQVDSRLAEIQEKAVDRERGTCIYGNRFILHVIFRLIEIPKLLAHEGKEFNEFLSKKIPELTKNTINNTLKSVDNHYSENAVYHIFRSLDKYKFLREKVLENKAP